MSALQRAQALNQVLENVERAHMSMVGNVRAHIQRGARLEPGGVHNCAVQDETAPAESPACLNNSAMRAGRKGGRWLADTG